MPSESAKAYPAPVELDQRALEILELSRRIGRALAAQHPGVQIAESFDTLEGNAVRMTFDIAHPAGDLSFSISSTDTPSGAVGNEMERVAKSQAMRHFIDRWNSRLTHVMRHVKVTNADGGDMSIEEGFLALSSLMAKVKGSPAKFIFIGNGGSASIASHMAEDFTKTAGVRAVTFNDSALLTCFANDYGWEKVFGAAVTAYGLPGDVLVAISSSGNSANVVEAVDRAKESGIVPVTFSGFSPDNVLRARGTINFWVPSHEYGFVETAHAALLHSALDIFRGWVGQP